MNGVKLAGGASGAGRLRQYLSQQTARSGLAPLRLDMADDPEPH